MKESPQISGLRRESRSKCRLRIAELIGYEQRLILLTKSVVGVELRARILLVEQWSLATATDGQQRRNHDGSHRP